MDGHRFSDFIDYVRALTILGPPVNEAAPIRSRKVGFERYLSAKRRRTAQQRRKATRKARRIMRRSE